MFEDEVLRRLALSRVGFVRRGYSDALDDGASGSGSNLCSGVIVTCLAVLLGTMDDGVVGSGSNMARK